MRKLASEIRQNLELLAEEYDRRLQEIANYADMPDLDRLEAARNVLLLVAGALEAQDRALLAQFVQAIAAERVSQGFEIESVQQALTILAEILEPRLPTVEAANFLWRAMVQSHTALSQAALERMRVAEEQFRFLADNIAVGIFIYQDGILRYVGREAARLLGYDGPHELRGRSILDVVHPDERARIAEFARRRVAGEPAPDQYETRLLKMEGTALAVWMHSRLTEYQGRTAVIGAFVDITERKRLEQQLQESLARRERQLQTSTEVAQEIAAAPALDELYHRVVTLVKEQFAYYHVHLFLLNEAGDRLATVAGYGEVGRRLLAQGHFIPMGRGVVGRAGARGQPVLSPDVGQDPEWLHHPLLPDTKGELAVPIKLRDQVLGVLDVQSDRAGALTEEDQFVLEGLCGQIAIAIESTRLRQETEESLRELERLYHAVSREGWGSFQRGVESTGYLFDRTEVVPVDDYSVPEIELAAKRQTVVASTDGSELAVVAPLTVRGEIFGALGIQDDPGDPLSPDDLALVESVAEQVAQALESARLFDQTQTTLAETEALYQVGRLITAAQSVDEVLAAMLEYVRRFDADRCLIALLDDPDVAPADRQVEVHAVWDREGAEAAFLGNRFTPEHIPALAKLGPADQLVVADFATSDQVDERTRATFQVLGVGAAAIVPLAVGGRLLGWLLVEAVGRTRAFADQEVEALQSIAGQAAVAVQSVRHLAETQVHAEELAVLNELGQALTARLDVQEVLDEAYRQASRLVDTTNFYVALYDPEREEIRFALMITESEIDSQIVTMPASQGLSGYMIRNRTSLLLRDNVRERQETLGVPMVGEEAQSWLGVPMVVGDRVLGSLAVASFTTPRLYDEHDRDLLMAIASPTAIAIENALLLEQAQARAERERLVRVITHRVRQGADRDIIMRTTLRELNEMLGASRSVMRLGTQEQLLSAQESAALGGEDN